MTSPHLDPERNGIVFGAAVVTIDPIAGGCVLTAPVKGIITTSMRRIHLHSLDEICGAHQAQATRAKTDPVARDIAAALKFAGNKIRAHEQRKRK